MSNKENLNIENSKENNNEKQEITLLIEKLDKLIKFKEEDIKNIEKQDLKEKEIEKQNKEILEKEKKETEEYKDKILNVLTDLKEKQTYTDTLTLEENTQLTEINDSLISLNLLGVVLVVLFAINIFAKGWLSRGH